MFLRHSIGCVWCRPVSRWWHISYRLPIVGRLGAPLEAADDHVRGDVQGRFGAIIWTATVAFLLASLPTSAITRPLLAPTTSVLAGMVISRLLHVPPQASPASVAVFVAMLGSILVLNIFVSWRQTSGETRHPTWCDRSKAACTS